MQASCNLMALVLVLKFLEWKWGLNPKTSRTPAVSGDILPISHITLFNSQFCSLAASVIFSACVYGLVKK